jgi:PleD family two-component response regulator
MADPQDSLHDLLVRADAMLYRAKAAGRGCQVSEARELAPPLCTAMAV